MSLPRRKNLDVRAEKIVAFYFLPSYDKYIIYILSAISAEDRPTFPVICISLLQLNSAVYFRSVYDGSLL